MAYSTSPPCNREDLHEMVSKLSLESTDDFSIDRQSVGESTIVHQPIAAFFMEGLSILWTSYDVKK